MNRKTNYSPIKRIAFVGNYLPRQCGIATFTTDVCEAVASAYKNTACMAVPVNDIEGGYEYPERVRFELTEKDINSYRRAADGDTIRMYYGAADTSIALATGSLNAMLDWLDRQ